MIIQKHSGVFIPWVGTNLISTDIRIFSDAGVLRWGTDPINFDILEVQKIYRGWDNQMHVVRAFSNFL